MVNEQTLAFILFFSGLFVFAVLTAMIYYYDRKYYGDEGIIAGETEEEAIPEEGEV